MSPTPRPTDSRPGEPGGEIRVLRHLARAGGTVVSKCLATMHGVALLSEIHPLAIRMFNPLTQAREWFNLYTEAEINALVARNPTFNAAIGDIDRRARDAGLTLLIREWSHLDYLGVPFLPTPPCRPVTLEMLGEEFAIIQAATVRHPIDQWISTARLWSAEVRRKGGGLSLGKFLDGYRRFAENALPHGIVRYEDLAADPDTHLKILCERLRLPFDPGYRERWFVYAHITGHVNRPGARSRKRMPTPCAPSSATPIIAPRYRCWGTATRSELPRLKAPLPPGPPPPGWLSPAVPGWRGPPACGPRRSTANPPAACDR